MIIRLTKASPWARRTAARHRAKARTFESEATRRNQNWENEQFQHEYDLAVLPLVRRRGQCFSVSGALRHRERYENYPDYVKRRVWRDFQT